MRVTASTDENFMIAQFLLAEIDSSRFSSTIRQILSKYSLSEDLIKNPHFSDITENQVRKLILGATRGYGMNAYLFTNFPENVDWKIVELESNDFKNIVYANHETWNKLTNNTRKLLDGAKKLAQTNDFSEDTGQIHAIAADFLSGKTYPDLILLNDLENKRLILVEGHSRATAYALHKHTIEDPIKAVVGYSDKFNNWAYY